VDGSSATASRCPANTSSRTVIWLRVGVPVLSVQIWDVLPSVSTDASRLTSAPRFASREAPIARVNVTTAGRPSGIAATANDTALTNSAPNSCPRSSPSPDTTAPPPPR